MTEKFAVMATPQSGGNAKVMHPLYDTQDEANVACRRLGILQRNEVARNPSGTVKQNYTVSTVVVSDDV